MVEATAVQTRFKLLEGLLDERLRRCVAAAEVKALGRGGVSAVSRATGVSRRAIRVGLRELAEASGPGPGRVRKPGAGRKRTVDTDPTLLQDLILLVEPTTRGDPESPLRWTCKSVRHLAKELTDLGHRTSHRMVAALLRSLDYSLQANRKTREGTSHPDRNAQFEYIDRRAAAYLRSPDATDPLGPVASGPEHVVGRESFKDGVVVSPVDELRHRHRFARRPPVLGRADDRHQLVRLFVGQRSKHDSIDDAEDGSIRSDAEC